MHPSKKKSTENYAVTRLLFATSTNPYVSKACRGIRRQKAITESLPVRVRTNRSALRPSVRVDGVLFLLALFPWLLEAEGPTITAVVNAATNISASSVPVVARGAIISISGTNLANATLTPRPLPFPTAMGGTQVLFGGIAGSLLYVSPNQINVQVPFELPDVSSVDMVVQSGGAVSAPLKVTLLAQDPGIYVVLKSGRPVNPSNPVVAGDWITIWATGLGAVVPPVSSGQSGPFAPLSILAIPPIVKIGGQIARVGFAGMAPGLIINQINARAPADLVGPTSDVILEPGVIPAVTGPPGPVGPAGSTGAAGPVGPHRISRDSWTDRSHRSDGSGRTARTTGTRGKWGRRNFWANRAGGSCGPDWSSGIDLARFLEQHDCIQRGRCSGIQWIELCQYSGGDESPTQHRCDVLEPPGAGGT
jgi:uncharacterized protein (TIGR03437 family)